MGQAPSPSWGEVGLLAKRWSRWWWENAPELVRVAVGLLANGMELSWCWDEPHSLRSGEVGVLAKKMGSSRCWDEPHSLRWGEVGSLANGRRGGGTSRITA